MLKRILLVLIALAGALPATAQEPALDEEFAFLEAEDVEKIPVSVATRGAAIPAGQAPAVVDVITSEEIRVSGARTLAELLSQRVGIDVSLDRLVPRGLNTSFVVGAPIENHRSLLLIDGRPTNSVVFGGFLAGRELPLEHIARIEIIRGPGSALYGTNAEAGVINVVTKDAADLPPIGTAIEYGSFNTARADLFGGHGSPRLNGSFFLRFFRTGGADQLTDNDDQRQFYGFGRARAGDFHFEVEALNFREENPGTISTPRNQDWTKRRRYSFGVQYEKDLGDQFHLEARAYANFFRDEFFTEVNAARGSSRFDDTRYGQEASLTYEPTSWAAITIGAEVREEFGKFGRCKLTANREDFRTEDSCDPDQIVLGAYLDDRIELTRDITLSAGVRYDRVSTQGQRFSPRANLFWQIDPRTSFKVGYGEAFRAPSFFELRGAQSFGTEAFVLGNPGLESEVVRTFEGELARRQNRMLNLRLSAFYTEGEDLISQVTTGQLDLVGACPPTGPGSVEGFQLLFCNLLDVNLLNTLDLIEFENADQVQVVGAEAGLGGLFPLPVPGEVHYGLNYTFQHTKNDSFADPKDLPLAPQHKVNILLDYRPFRDLSLFWHIRWLDRQFGDAIEPEDSDLPILEELFGPPPPMRTRLGSFFNHNVNVNYRVTRELELGLGVYNVLDGFEREAVGIPREPRTFLGLVRYRRVPPPPIPPPPVRDPEPAELGEARAAVERARAEDAEKWAPEDLRDARARLDEAEDRYIRGESRARIVEEAERAQELARRAIDRAIVARERAASAPTPVPTPPAEAAPRDVREPTPRPGVVETPSVPGERTPVAVAPTPVPTPEPVRTPEPVVPEPTPTPDVDLSNREILVLQSDGKIAVYREATFSLLRELPGNIRFVDLSGDPETGIRALRADTKRPDLVVAIGSLAASVLDRTGHAHPSVFCAALGPERYGLPNENVGGVGFELSASTQLGEIRSALPEARRVGVLYNPASSGAFVDKAVDAAARLGLRLVPAVVDDPRDVGFVFRSMREDVDVLWILPDPTVVTRESFEVLRHQTAEAGMPFVAYAESFARKGALLALFPDAASVGRQCADLSRSVLTGDVDVADVGHRSPEAYRVAVNRRVGELLGVTLGAGLKADVEIR